MHGQNNNDQNPMQQPNEQPLRMISAAEWEAKFPTKRLSYRFLAVECQVYLPPYGKCMSLGFPVYFLI